MLFINVGIIVIISIIFQPASPHCINSDTGINLEACLTISSETVCCESMSFLVESLVLQGHLLNISIHVQTNIMLNSTIEITDFEDLTIQGNNSTILCDRNMNHTGIYFKNTTNLKLFDLKIMNCSMLQGSSTFDVNAAGDPTCQELVLCAIYILNCTDLTIENTAVSNSRGTGVIVYNTKGLVQILNSNFSNNKVENGSSYAGGGGLVIEFTLYKLQSTEDHNCTRNVMEDANYIIKNCIFDENQAYKNSTYVYHSKKSFKELGRGGGLYISMRGHTEMNAFNITHCKFINNSASTWGEECILLCVKLQLTTMLASLIVNL